MVIQVIHRLFIFLCFESTCNIIPTVWRQAITCPILKDISGIEGSAYYQLTKCTAKF
jgi:hypothetical protein